MKLILNIPEIKRSYNWDAKLKYNVLQVTVDKVEGLSSFQVDFCRFLAKSAKTS